MNDKFTPGPWRVNIDQRDGDVYGGVQNAYIDGKNSRLAYVWDVDKPGGMANARLIAQAPAMYAAIKAALRYLKSLGMEDISLGEELRAAIAGVEDGDK